MGYPVMDKSRGTLKDRLFRQVLVLGPEECWEWQSKSRIKGYGVIGIGGRKAGKMLAHRASWEIHNGPIPANSDEHHGTIVMHKCDNRLCINPNHLMLGTQADNVHDMDNKSRRVSNPRKGSSHHMTTINEDQAAKVFVMSGKYRKIAETIGCSIHVVKDIRCGKTWSHITGGLTRG